VSNQMFQKFTEAVRAELERPDEPAAAPTPVETAASPSTAAAIGAPAAPLPGVEPASPPLVSGSTAGLSPASPRPAPAPAPPIEVFSFGGKILARATGRMMRRPLFWVVVAAGAVLIYRLFH